MVLISSFPYRHQLEPGARAGDPAHDARRAGEGTAIAEALFGEINPGGRLVQTWRIARPGAADDGLQHPPWPDLHVLQGRAALPVRLRPQLHDVRLFEPEAERREAGREGQLTVSVDVTNTGKRAGDEVVQLYVTHLNSEVERPLKELRGFRRVTLQPGETKTVELRCRVEPGLLG